MKQHGDQDASAGVQENPGEEARLRRYIREKQPDRLLVECCSFGPEQGEVPQPPEHAKDYTGHERVAAASSAATAGDQVHACPKTPSGAPEARGTHTTHAITKTSRKKVTKGWRRIDRAIPLPPTRHTVAQFVFLAIGPAFPGSGHYVSPRSGGCGRHV